MMKKTHTVFKTVQLVVFTLLAAFTLYLIFSDGDLYHNIAADASVKRMCAVLWALFGLSFIAIFVDLTMISRSKKDLRELDYTVHSDPVAGIANRYSCDAMIEKYLDKPVPADIGCIMFDITNIGEINKLYGHLRGNDTIHDFSSILKLTSVNLCFVGRNGGNKFLCLFEDCSEEKMESFLMRVRQKVDSHNASAESYPIQYKYGVGFQEGDKVKTITELISLANRRIYWKDDEID